MPNAPAPDTHPRSWALCRGARPERRQSCAADAALVSAADGCHLPGPDGRVHGRLRRPIGSCSSAACGWPRPCAGRGIGPGDTVAAMLPNIPAMLEAHHGVPMCGAVLNALNTRLDAGRPRVHARARRSQGAAHRHRVRAGRCARRCALVGRASAGRSTSTTRGPGWTSGSAPSTTRHCWPRAIPTFAPLWPADEWQAIALNYTSGTTGNPKGVVYHHRGAHLNAVGNVLVWSMPQFPIYLWTLPMFHCNGWCFPWAIVLQAGTQVCLRRVASDTIFAGPGRARRHASVRRPDRHGHARQRAEPAGGRSRSKVRMMTAASAPPAAVLEKMEALGIEVTHVYGLTEVYGPATVCAWQEEWARARRRGPLAQAGAPGRAATRCSRASRSWTRPR